MYFYCIHVVFKPNTTCICMKYTVYMGEIHGVYTLNTLYKPNFPIFKAYIKDFVTSILPIQNRIFRKFHLVYKNG